VLLYDLTSTYFESDPPFEEDDKRRFGYSRDHRFDCVQVVIALIVTPEGLPLTYEVLTGNTADATTLPPFPRPHRASAPRRGACTSSRRRSPRPEVRVKLLPEEGDLYVCVESQAWIGKERSMRRRRFKRYGGRLKELQRQRPYASPLSLQRIVQTNAESPTTARKTATKLKISTAPGDVFRDSYAPYSRDRGRRR